MSDNDDGDKVITLRPKARKHDRRSIMNSLCELLETGMSLTKACSIVPASPSSSQILDWIVAEPALAEQYALAREAGYKIIADEILAIADENFTTVEEDVLDESGSPVMNADGHRLQRSIKVPLSNEGIARNRLRIDSRKWMLSKMLPKVYGDKIQTEHTGPNGGPVQLTAVDMKNLSDDELESMTRMMKKIGTPE